ncbi:peptidoglycan-binding domain-containing protein [Curtobacterium sp. VKM Ac-1393]|uniref:peptidoglycan-binding domain-containing protein n=1 Tax=Curtobacterium sp. VKM Ac-1393 TaxID=2783814 RepID=UPI00188C18F9|nr:hypothetical protein [Curtobacterium sp. VKM Ac-1393]MBF4606831.1 hypothetical protein [Curtobacterium sp. VKM Ac-1393]
MQKNIIRLAMIGALVASLTGAGVVGQGAPAEAAMARISPACSSVPTTTTESDGVPGSIFYKRLQCLASMSSYTGPIDGVMGPNSWKGVSSQLANGGFFQGGIAQGWESTDNVAALQRWAAAHGRYSGPIDGVWGPNSYRGVAWVLNRVF